MIVLDTSALLLWTLDPGRVSETAAHVIAGAEQILVSSISIWEIALKVRRGNLEIPIEVDEYVDRLGKVRGLEILPIEVRDWLENVHLDWEHRDPADRTIVALATRLGIPLVTSDQTIRDFYPKTVW